MKKKKGFTLVELLAVIVILAVLVLLAVPSVLKMLDGSKKQAFEVEAENIVKAAKLAYADSLINTTTFTTTTITTPVTVDSTPATASGTCIDISDLGDYIDKNMTGTKGSVLIDSENNKYYIWYTDGTHSVTGDPSGAITADASTILVANATNWDNCITAH